MNVLIPPLASGWHYFFGIVMFVTALFLILLILVQRGRGGGLAGAFGGMGGQSAFGTKAGDLFTKLTIGVATFWIFICVIAISVLNRQTSVFGDSPSGGDSSVFGSLEDDSATPPEAVSPDTPPTSETVPTDPSDGSAAGGTPSDSGGDSGAADGDS